MTAVKAVTDLLVLADRLENPPPGAPGFFYGKWGNVGGEHPCGTVACAAGQASLWIDGHSNEWGEHGFSSVLAVRNWQRDGMPEQFFEWAFCPRRCPPQCAADISVPASCRSPSACASAVIVAAHLRIVSDALRNYHFRRNGERLMGASDYESNR